MVEQAVLKLIEEAFSPQYLELINESHMHSVPPNSETHFKLVLVCSEFEGLNKVRRHQAVYGAVSEYMSNPIHALALHTYSPDEWTENSTVVASPNCLGGSKAD